MRKKGELKGYQPGHVSGPKFCTKFDLKSLQKDLVTNDLVQDWQRYQCTNGKGSRIIDCNVKEKASQAFIELIGFKEWERINDEYNQTCQRNAKTGHFEGGNGQTDNSLKDGTESQTESPRDLEPSFEIEELVSKTSQAMSVSTVSTTEKIENSEKMKSNQDTVGIFVFELHFSLYFYQLNFSLESTWKVHGLGQGQY